MLRVGAQDVLAENRPTGLMAPGLYASLEITALTGSERPGPAGGFANDDVVTITKDEIDFPGIVQTDQATSVAGKNQGQTFKVNCAIGHGCMSLVGRNAQGVYEPKVMYGLGYTITD